MVPLESSPFLLEQRSSHTTSSCSFIDLYFREYKYFIQHFPVMHRLGFMYGTVCARHQRPHGGEDSPRGRWWRSPHTARAGERADIARDARGAMDAVDTPRAEARDLPAEGRVLEEEEQEDVSFCPIFTTDDDATREDLPRRNLDAAFASTPTLPKKRRMPMLVDGNGERGPRQFPVARSGLGGATEDELSLERVQVRPLVETRSFSATLPLPRASLPGRRAAPARNRC